MNNVETAGLAVIRKWSTVSDDDRPKDNIEMTPEFFEEMPFEEDVDFYVEITTIRRCHIKAKTQTEAAVKAKEANSWEEEFDTFYAFPIVD